MEFRTILLATALIAAAGAATARSLPADVTPEQERLVSDWQKYSTACRGGAVDGSAETMQGYCGTRDYLMWRLAEAGICTEDGLNWTRCTPSTDDPLADYPF